MSSDRISQCLIFLQGIFLNCRFISVIYHVVCNFFNRLQQATNKSQEISWKNIVLIWKSEVFIKRKGTNARSCRMSKCIKQKQQAAEAHHAAYRTRIEKLTSENLWNTGTSCFCFIHLLILQLYAFFPFVYNENFTSPNQNDIFSRHILIFIYCLLQFIEKKALQI